MAKIYKIYAVTGLSQYITGLKREAAKNIFKNQLIHKLNFV